MYHIPKRKNNIIESNTTINLFSIPKTALQGSSRGIIYKQERRYLTWAVTLVIIMHLPIYVCSLRICAHIVYSKKQNQNISYKFDM